MRGNDTHHAAHDLARGPVIEHVQTLLGGGLRIGDHGGGGKELGREDGDQKTSGHANLIRK